MTTEAPPAPSMISSRGQMLLYLVVRGFLAGFCHVFWRVKVEGRENVPAEGPFILSPVHRSNVDTPVAGCVTRRRMRFVGKESMWRFRWSAWLFDGMGGFPVHRSGADREALRLCEAALRFGDPVVIFPEGTRKAGPEVKDLFDGAAFLATRTGAPIVPVGIGGSARAMPLGARYLRPGKVTVIIGDPLRPPPPAEGSRNRRHQVHELTAQLQAELQRLFDLAEEKARPRRSRRV